MQERVSAPRIVVARGRELVATVAALATVNARNKCDETRVEFRIRT